MGLSFKRGKTIFFVRSSPYSVHTIKNSMERRMNPTKKQGCDAVLDILKNFVADRYKVRPVTDGQCC